MWRVIWPSPAMWRPCRGAWPPFRSQIAQAAGLTLLILAGLITLFYTKDSPAEKWVKQTRFDTRPADWSKTYVESMVAFYQMLMPASMELRR